MLKRAVFYYFRILSTSWSDELYIWGNEELRAFCMSALTEGSCQLNIVAASPPGKISRYPVDTRLSGPRAGVHVVQKTKNNFTVWHPAVLLVLTNSTDTAKHIFLLINSCHASNFERVFSLSHAALYFIEFYNFLHFYISQIKLMITTSYCACRCDTGLLINITSTATTTF